MSTTSRSRTDAPADHVARRQDAEISRVKLQALAAALHDVGLRSRETDRGDDRIPVLRVWDPCMQSLSETLTCVSLAEGWRFACYPSGPVVADADGIYDADEAKAAARVIAARVSGGPANL